MLRLVHATFRPTGGSAKCGKRVRRSPSTRFGSQRVVIDIRRYGRAGRQRPDTFKQKGSPAQSGDRRRESVQYDTGTRPFEQDLRAAPGIGHHQPRGHQPPTCGLPPRRDRASQPAALLK